eukprot:TRINITY_DN1443_c0_g1_i1.p1 TRINITY_DN1443_c0_g1~~TRINITY_DN1443_c0_g1_i1.p1  ORF type:complete len:435 (-),score=127.94 TRINITY_DN1443_c0_g1_i1:203-1507(-)
MMAFSRKQQTSQGAYGGRPYHRGPATNQHSDNNTFQQGGATWGNKQSNWGQKSQHQQQWSAQRQARKQPMAAQQQQHGAAFAAGGAAAKPPRPVQQPPLADNGQGQAQGKVQVTLGGLPNTLCTRFMLEAMLEQAGLELSALLELKVWSGEPCGGASIFFATHSDALRCARHFDGCQWAGAKVTTTIHSAQDASASSSKSEEASKKEAEAAPKSQAQKQQHSQQQAKQQQQPQQQSQKQPLPQPVQQQPQQQSVMQPASPLLQAQTPVGVIIAQGVWPVFPGMPPSKANSDDGASTHTPVTNDSNKEQEDGMDDDLWEVRTDDGFEENSYSRVHSLNTQCGTPPSEISTAFGSPACSFGSPPMTPMMHCLTPMGGPPAAFWAEMSRGDMDSEEAKRRGFTPPPSPLGAALMQPLPAAMYGSEMMIAWAPAPQTN